MREWKVIILLHYVLRVSWEQKDLEKKRNIKVTYNNITCTVHIRYGIYEVDYDSKVDVGTMCDRARMALDSYKE